MCSPSRFRIALLAAMLSPGCERRDPERERADSAATDSVAVTSAAPWYRGMRTMDLTGDGQADSVRLEAFGSRTDSLRVILSLVVGGEEKHREEWGSSYELALLDSAARASSQVDGFLRAQLDTVLASVVVQPLDAPSVRLMAEDSVILAGLEPRPTHRISFLYGYESAARLVWDAPRERFIRLWTCC